MFARSYTPRWIGFSQDDGNESAKMLEPARPRADQNGPMAGRLHRLRVRENAFH
jgi:hypothetical protein